MTKSELAEQVSAKINLTKKETEHIVSIIFESIIGALSSGDKVEVRGFGSFRIRHRALREGRNPKTGEKITIQARKAPGFTPGKTLKKAVR